MILYTPLSYEEIFPQETSNVNRQVISYNGTLIHVEEVSPGSYEVLQLLSTNPQDYLNETFFPGSRINPINIYPANQ